MSIQNPAHNKMANAFGDTRFRFYPCGFLPDSYFPTMAYVRYKPLNRQSFDQPVKVIDRGYRWVLYDTPDREVLFTRDGLTLGADRPLNDHGSEPWHTAVSLAINAQAGDDIPFDRYMINPHTVTERIANKMRKETTIVKSDKIIMSDCLVWDTMIPTTSGVYPIGYIVSSGKNTGKREYKGNIQVLDLEGKPTKITHVFSSPEERDIYRTLTRHGQVIEGSANHLIEVVSEADASGTEWVTLSEVKTGSKALMKFGLDCWSETNVKIHAPNRGSFKHTEITPELALFMGLIAAAAPRQRFDGENCLLSVDSDEAATKICSLCDELFDVQVTFSRKDGVWTIVIPAASFIFTFLSNLGAGLYNPKKSSRVRAPWSVLQSTKECVIQYMRGWFLASGRIRNQDISILVRNDLLAQNLSSLLMYLGVPNNIVVSNHSPYSSNIIVRDNRAINTLVSMFDLRHMEGYDNLCASDNEVPGVIYSFRGSSEGWIESAVVSSQVVRKEQVFDITLDSEEHSYLAGPAMHTHNSGGFQLGSGAATFINPIDLCGFYSDNVDEGVILDIPARQIGDDPEIMKHTARVHELNVKMMAKHLPKGFRMANVVHGRSLKILDDYRARTEYAADYDICCLAGMLYYNIIEAVYRIMYVISKGRKYKQYHILGASNPPLLAALIRLAYLYKKTGEHIMITNDSSSPIQFAVKRTYYSQPNHYDPLSAVKYGTKNDAPASHLTNPHRRFGTNDPISSILGGYQDFMNADYNIMATSYALFQNQIELTRYVNQTCWYAEHLDDKQYRELMQAQYRNSVHGNLLLTALDFMTCAFEQGLDTAYKKYKSYMPKFTGERGFRKFPSLFEGEGQEEEIENAKVMASNKKRLIKVIKGYYEFHRSGRVPEAFVQENKAKRKTATQQLLI